MSKLTNREIVLRSLAEMTDEEEAEINAGIAADPDARELTDDDFARMRPALEVFTEAFGAEATKAMIKPPLRGRPKLERPKLAINLRLDQDVIDAFRATGAGWRTRINAVLRQNLPKAG